jgi:hypothetical protein
MPRRTIQDANRRRWRRASHPPRELSSRANGTVRSGIARARCSTSFCHGWESAFRVPRSQPSHPANEDSSWKRKAVWRDCRDAVVVILALVAGIHSDRALGDGNEANTSFGMDPCDGHRDDDCAGGRPERVLHRRLRSKRTNSSLTIHSRPRATPWHPCNTISQSHRQPAKRGTCRLHGQNRLIGMDHEKGSPDSACFGCFWFRF